MDWTFLLTNIALGAANKLIECIPDIIHKFL